MRKAKSTKQKLLELADSWVPDLKKAYIDAIKDVVDNVVLKDVIAAINDGDLEKIFKVIGLTEAALRPLTAAIERAYESGGVAVGQTFPKNLRTNSGVRGVFRFNVRDSRAEKWISEESSRAIVQITEGTRNAVRNVAFEGVRDGRNPRSVALDIVGRIDPVTKSRVGGVVGLTNNQERWVANTAKHLTELNETISLKFGEIPLNKYLAKIQKNPYFARELRAKGSDRTIMKYAREGKEIPGDVLAKLISKYKDNALRYRGEVIARTEALNALRASNREAFLQAVDMGAAKRSSIRRVWANGGDKRVREDHVEMEGQTVGFDEPFTAPDGSLLMIPGDSSLGASAEQTIQCRCIEEYQVDWFDV